MAASSTASATWKGALATGSGNVSTKSPALDAVAVTWRARVGEEAGTTPEELLGAAHAACYSMALSGALAKAGNDPEQLDVTAEVSFGPKGEGFAVLGVKLHVEATVPGIDEAAFLEFANGAKTGCPISGALAGNVPIELEARLLQHA